MSLDVRFTRLSPTHHRFEAIGADGAREVRELETRSLLLHDLVHFALESEAGLTHGFYGRLAKGGGYDAELEGSEAMAVESVVGPLQGAIKGAIEGAGLSQLDAEAFVARLRTVRESIAERAPDWLTPELIGRTLRRLIQLQGQWRATAFGETLALKFEVE